ncbi:MAG: ABC transporter ATP-binding protein [Burkholderiales bacterium]
MAEIIVRTENLTKKYDDLVAVNDLNLKIREGEVFGLLGPNGAGKTTTILMLLGLTEPNSGKAEIFGRDCTRDPIGVKRVVGYLPDSVAFYDDLTGRENLRFTGELNGIPRKELEERIDMLLKRVGMESAADKKTRTYSRGMTQRLGIADVLMKDPKVVILDEPTLGIDPEGMRELLIMIKDLSVKDGRTVIISSHMLYQIQQICDRVGIFYKGRLVDCGTIDELGAKMREHEIKSIEYAASPDNVELKSMLEGIKGVEEVTQERGIYVVHSKDDLRGALVDETIRKGYSLRHLKLRGGDLEEIYRRYFEKEEAV